MFSAAGEIVEGEMACSFIAMAAVIGTDIHTFLFNPEIYPMEAFQVVT